MSAARTPVALHRLGLGTALLAAALAPLALAAPAEATTTAHGCTVRPIRPAHVGTVAGVKQIRYEVVLACAGDRRIEVQPFAMEDDAPPQADQYIGTQVLSRTFVDTNVASRSIDRPLPNTEVGAEEVYTKARFRVSVAGGPFSAWTAFDSGPTLTIAN